MAPEVKLKIIAEAKIEGVKVTLDKHGVYPATCYSWKRKLLVDDGKGTLSDGGRWGRLIDRTIE